jgi:hypothetical protein
VLGVGSIQVWEVDCLGTVLCYNLGVGHFATPVDPVRARFALGLQAYGLAAMLQQVEPSQCIGKEVASLLG